MKTLFKILAMCFEIGSMLGNTLIDLYVIYQDERLNIQPDFFQKHLVVVKLKPEHLNSKKTNRCKVLYVDF